MDALLNLLLFAPLGVGLGSAGARPKRAILGMIAGTVIIELLQYFVMPGRDPTLRDVVLNSIGAAIGYAAGARPQVIVMPSRSAATKLLLAWSAGWLVEQSVAAYALVPVLPQSQYYGQIARDLGTLPAFSGTVLRARVDSVIIPNWELADGRVRELLLRREGALVQATVIPDGCPDQLSGIVRIADAAALEVLLLAQDGVDLVFALRTGAQVLRLRPMHYRLRDAFGTGTECSAQSDTIQVQARYTPRSVFLHARREREIRPSVAQGWRLFLPVPMDVEASPLEAAITAMWLMGLFFPVGYWGRAAMARPNRRRNASMVVLVFAAVTTGLAVIPYVLGAPASNLEHWTLAGVSAAAGVFIARLTQRKRFDQSCDPTTPHLSQRQHPVAAKDDEHSRVR